MGTPGPFGTLPLSWADTSFQLLLDALPDAVFIVDSTAKIVAANKQAGIIFGYNRNDLIGSLITALVPPGLRDRLDLAFKEYFRDPNARPGAVGLELLVQRRDGTDFPAEINLSSISPDASTFIIITIRDVSAMNRLSELNESPVVSDGNYENEEGSWLSVDFESIMTWASGTDKLCTYFSSQWLAFTGRSMEQEWGNGWAQGVHPNDLQRCLYVFSQAFDRREKFKLEFRLRRHDGEYRWIFELGVPRFNSDHTFAGYVGSCVEVTSLNRMEEALREKEMELLESQR
ncbi:MAG TPA: PAS domain S-box protein, partial [Candidatus Acidoferrales bacterium]